jgi:hypothetical protein
MSSSSLLKLRMVLDHCDKSSDSELDCDDCNEILDCNKECGIIMALYYVRVCADLGALTCWGHSRTAHTVHPV